MTITFQLEDDLEQQLRRDLGDLSHAARESLLIEAYRMGNLSIGRLARTLGMGVIEADQWLAQRSVALNYSFEAFQADQRTVCSLRNPESR
jgi:predicted HTH domain antitoxin